MKLLEEKDIDRLKEVRRRLHSMAELSGEEQETSDYIRDFMEKAGADYITEKIGGYGLLAGFKADKEGPAVLLRCELDALPIRDEIDADYVSAREGTGHKCGHDGHMAVLCGVAEVLGQGFLERGEVMLLFQPAEETGEGAERVLQDDKFENVNPDYVFALHNLPGYEKNGIVVRENTFAAASTGFIARFRGQTSHAAHPEEGRSPTLAVAQLIQSLSSLPQFESPLDESAKCTVIHARLGERAFGTSPGEAEVMATLRTYSDDMLEKLKRRAAKISSGLAETYGLTLETEWPEPFPATVNDSTAVDVICRAAEKNGLKIKGKEAPFGWSEDFGHFTKNFKGAMFGLGAGRSQAALHASEYDFPDELIATGISIFTGIINELTNDS